MPLNHAHRHVVEIFSFPFEYEGRTIQRSDIAKTCAVQVVAAAVDRRSEMMLKGDTRLPDIDEIAKEVNSRGFEDILSDYDEVVVCLSETELQRLMPDIHSEWNWQKPIMGG